MELRCLYPPDTATLPLSPNATITFGRDARCSVPFTSDKRVSGAHASISVAPSGPPLLTDSGSRNGTYVNGARIVPGSVVPLTHGDIVSLLGPHTVDPPSSVPAFEVVVLAARDVAPDSLLGKRRRSIPDLNATLELSTLKSDDDKDDVEGEGDTAPEAGSIKRQKTVLASDVATAGSAAASTTTFALPAADAAPPAADAAPPATDAAPPAADTANSALAEHLVCCICQDVLYKAVSVSPCMHSFCHGCLSEWMGSSRECPMCRSLVESVGVSHTIRNIVDDFLKANPGEVREQAERDALDAKAAKLSLGKVGRGSRSSASSHNTAGFGFHAHDSYDDYDSYGSGAEDFYMAPPMPPPPPPVSSATTLVTARCRECVTARGEDGFTCPADAGEAGHSNCSVCLEPFPSRAEWADRLRCGRCSALFCDPYWTCRASRGVGALKPLRDWQFTAIPARILNDNMVEQEHYANYLGLASLSPQDVFDRIIASLDAGHYSHPSGTGASTPACRDCASLVFRDLVLEDYKRVPRDQLPAPAASRPDCHWGSACRTQRRVGHAQRYNHICNQTRGV